MRTSVDPKSQNIRITFQMYQREIYLRFYDNRTLNCKAKKSFKKYLEASHGLRSSLFSISWEIEQKRNTQITYVRYQL